MGWAESGKLKGEQVFFFFFGGGGVVITLHDKVCP